MNLLIPERIWGSRFRCKAFVIREAIARTMIHVCVSARAGNLIRPRGLAPCSRSFGRKCIHSKKSHSSVVTPMKISVLHDTRKFIEMISLRLRWATGACKHKNNVVRQRRWPKASKNNLGVMFFLMNAEHVLWTIDLVPWIIELLPWILKAANLKPNHEFAFFPRRYHNTNCEIGLLRAN